MDESTARPVTIQIAGLGGQGVVLAGDILAEAALQSGMNVKKSEIHGLSRRFGSVTCQVRIGDVLHSPLRGHGGVDVLLAMEGYEGLKLLPFLRPEGKGIFNRLWRKPGAMVQVEDIAPEVDEDHRIQWFDGSDLVHQAEAPRSLNFFMLGVLSTRLEIAENFWIDAIRGGTTKGLEMNLEMFQAGLQLAAPIAPRYRYHITKSAPSNQQPSRV